MDMKDRLSNLMIECSDVRFEDFNQWIVKKLWSEYDKEYMDKRLIIENKIKELPIVIPNGTVGKEYKATIRLPEDIIEDYWLDGLDKIGLQGNSEVHNVCTISGIPTTAGSFEIVLRYKYKGCIDEKDLLQRKFPIAINPDPRSLWKDIPTPEDIEYFQPDRDSTYVKVEARDGVPQKDIVAASQRGRSHAHEGNPRDDHFRVEYLDECGWYIMAVADGAGSAKYSRKGSWLACDTSVEHCKSYFSDKKRLHNFEEYITTYNGEANDEYRKLLGDSIHQLIGNAAFKSYKAIESEANTKGVPIKKYATTLLLAVCKKFDFGWFVASFWVGDGAMCIYDKERKYFKLLGKPDEGEFAGQTRFLTMPEIFRDATSFYGRLKFSIEQDFTALMLMTDGVSDPMFETDFNLNKIEKWDALWEIISNDVELTDDNTDSQYQLMQWLDFWSQGNHDDRTIAILY
jgi:serine/threonine protein phosphatase PrpC